MQKAKGRLFNSLESKIIHSVFLSVLLTFFAIACSDTHLQDYDSEIGQNAIKEEANKAVTENRCEYGWYVIKPLLDSGYADSEARIIAASTRACIGGFNFFDFVAGIAQSSSIFGNLAMLYTVGDNDYNLRAFTEAQNILFETNVVEGSMNAVGRPADVNKYLVFIEMAIIGSILNQHGVPDADGKKTQEIIYNIALLGDVTLNTISTRKACRLLNAFAITMDSLEHSRLADESVMSTASSLNSVCQETGLNSCSELPKEVEACDDNLQNQFLASQIVEKVNATWE